MTDQPLDRVEESATDPAHDHPHNPAEESATDPGCPEAESVTAPEAALATDPEAALVIDPEAALAIDPKGRVIDRRLESVIGLDDLASATGLDDLASATGQEDPVVDQDGPTGRPTGEIFTTTSIGIGTVITDARSAVAGGMDVILAGAPGDAPVMDAGIGGVPAPSVRSAVSSPARLGGPLGRSLCTTATVIRAACTTRTTSCTSTVTSIARVKSTTRRLRR